MCKYSLKQNIMRFQVNWNEYYVGGKRCVKEQDMIDPIRLWDLRGALWTSQQEPNLEAAGIGHIPLIFLVQVPEQELKYAILCSFDQDIGDNVFFYLMP